MSSRRSRRKAPALARTGKERDRRQDSQSSKREKKDAAPKVVEPINPKLRLGVGVALLVSFLWAYFPTFALLQREWERLPDYSHGYLVIPFALVLGWLRKESMPSFSSGFSIFGLGVIALAVAMRWVGDAYFYPVIGNNSIVLWAIGATWFLFGTRFLWWALPSLLFLGFMVPLPSRFSDVLSGTLQRIATMMSTWMLQLFDESSTRHPTDPPRRDSPPLPANAAVYLYGESLQSTVVCAEYNDDDAVHSRLSLQSGDHARVNWPPEYFVKPAHDHDSFAPFSCISIH